MTTLVVAVASWAVSPTGTVFPGSADNFQAVSPGDRWTSEKHNQILSALIAMQTSMFASGLPLVGCAAVSTTAGERKLVNVGMPSSLAGTEAAFCGVKDTTNPSRIECDGVQQVAGSTVQVWVFNRDAANARSGTVCVQASRTS